VLDPASLLATAVRRDPAGPLLTYYDDTTGERTELSATTVANWVAKTANLLRDDLDVEAGDSVAVQLPAHWQTGVVLLALWSIGALPTAQPVADGVAVTDETRADAALQAGARDVLALSLRPMNAPLPRPLPGVVDYAAEVLSAGDVLTGTRPSGQADAERAATRAGELGLAASDRLLVTDAVGLSDAVDWLLAPLAVGASVVLCRGADEARLLDRSAQERVTVTLGRSVAGVPRRAG
jgi:uncharacterized protein (TIGR03089 family)